MSRRHDSERYAAAEEHEIATWIRQAGRRPSIPSDAAARYRAVADDAWRDGLRRAQRRRWTRWAAAALVATLIGAVWLAGRHDTASATVEAVRGSVVTQLPDETAVAPLVVGALLAADTWLHTPPEASVAIRLAAGASVRLGADGRLQLRGPESVFLERGRLDVASGDARGRGPIAVHTRFGVVRDIGTRFQVAVADPQATGPALQVRVRTGRVRLDRAHEPALEIAAGKALTLTADGNAALGDQPVHGASWAWAFAAGPGFELDGKTLGAVLTWLRDETGWTVRFADPEQAAGHRAKRLSGSLDGLTPEQALDILAPAAGLAYRLDDGTVTLDAAR